MLPSELLARARNRLSDHDIPLYWSNSELEEYANATIYKLFMDVRRLVIDSDTPSDLSLVPLPVCLLPVVAGTTTYAMSPKVIDILAVTSTARGQMLALMTAAQMDAKVSGWRTFNNATSQQPWACITGLNTDSITLFPVPPTDDTIVMTVSRFPLQRLSFSQTGTKADDTIPLGFREEYHDYLLPGILAEAYSKSDSEISDPGKAVLFEKKFEDNIEKIKNDLSRRLSPNPPGANRRAFRSR